jgi:hypothetical protein
MSYSKPIESGRYFVISEKSRSTDLELETFAPGR